MKKKFITFSSLALALASVHLKAAPLGTAFTYQGRLDQNGLPATGLYQMTFWLYADAQGGNPIASNTVPTVPVTLGLFTTNVDFGPNRFTGDERWLAITVATNGSPTFTLLQPRTRLAPTPNAIYASTAGVANTVTTGAIQPSQLGTAGAPSPGQVLSYNGSSLVWQEPATPGGAWAIAGNNATSGNFLGSLNDQPLLFKANGSRILRLEPNIYAPNLVGGSANNFVSAGVEGATIAGGGTLTRFDGVYTNAIAADYATIGGGLGNRIALNGFDSTIAGGRENVLQFGAYRAAIGGGIGNTITSNSYESTIAGGNGNTAESNGAFVGGGYFNHAKGSSSTLAGGYDNTLTGDVDFIGGGARNRANNIFSTIAGGENNTTSGDYSTIGGGGRNTASGPWSSVAGGSGNRAAGYYATVPGGAGNQAAADFSFAAGLSARANHPGCFVWADSYLGPPPHPAEVPFPSIRNDEFAVRANGGVRFQAPYLRVSGSGNEDAYIGGDGVGGEVHVGSLNPNTTTIAMFNLSSSQYMHINMKSCTIFGGADLAEPFQMSMTNIPKGAVVVIDPENPGHLRMSREAYDKRVAGIVSGANGVNPGIALQQQGVLEGGQNVALSGRVYVQADASHGAIEPGDLLTTSDTPGHAMKVIAPEKAQGAILGKAMSALKEGTGMVLVLVTLQ